MRNVRYNVAASLDGFIAGPNGEFDWIPNDPTVDFAALFANVDAVLIGRKTYDVVRAAGAPPWPAGASIHVFSRTLRAADHPGVTAIHRDAATAVAALRAAPGRDIWLFGGGDLFASLLSAGQVSHVEVTVVPVMLGEGVRLFPGGATRVPLALETTRVYPSGMVSIHYLVSGIATAERKPQGRDGIGKTAP